MSFIKKPEDVAGGIDCGYDIYFHGKGEEAKQYPSEMLWILYESKMDVIKKLLPPPLEPIDKPYVLAQIDNFKKCNFDTGINGPGYMETALFLPCRYKGSQGIFTVGMNLNTDMAIFVGKDTWGYPKKFANIKNHFLDGVHYTGFAERHGIPFFVVTADFDKEPNDPNFVEEFNSVMPFDPEKPDVGVNFTFKWTIGKNEPQLGKQELFIHKPLLVKEWDAMYNMEEKIGFGDVHFTWSDDDPWAELEVVRVLGASLQTGEYVMMGPCEYEEVDPEEFAPYAFYGWDHSPIW